MAKMYLTFSFGNNSINDTVAELTFWVVAITIYYFRLLYLMSQILKIDIYLSKMVLRISD